MSTHIEFQEHFAGNAKLFISVWLWLLLLTALEVFLGYIHLPVAYMLVILMGASIIKAALMVAYFMHLRFERINLILTIVPALDRNSVVLGKIVDLGCRRIVQGKRMDLASTGIN